ncbi:MAG: hypothetical protein Q9167_005211 [Letrouitia subvulpina]
MQMQRFGQPVRPGRIMPRQSFNHAKWDCPLYRRPIRRGHHRDPFPVIAARLGYLDHPGGHVRVTHKGLCLFQAENVAVRLMLDEASRLNEDSREPSVVELQIILRVCEVLVDVGKRPRQQGMSDDRVLGVKLLVEAGGAQPDDGREFRVGTAPHADVHEGNDDRLRRILRNVGVGHIVVAGDGREDGGGVSEARGHEGGVANVAAKNLDLGVGGDVGELGKELGPRADVDVDAVLGVLDEELKDVSARATGGTKYCAGTHSPAYEGIFHYPARETE